jgi:hypothetical protein
MLSLTDQQLKTVADAARDVPQEKRDVYLQRIAAMLTIRGRGHFNDADVAEVAALGGVRTDATTARHHLYHLPLHQRHRKSLIGYRWQVF